MSLNELYVCSHCGAQFSKWSGRCSECGAWGTLVKSEEAQDSKHNFKKNKNIKASEVINFEKIENSSLQIIKTNIKEIDRVLGGGIVQGAVILLGGEPGIGKSTLVLQIVNAVNKYNNIRQEQNEGSIKNSNCLIVSGEESAQQVKSRIDRLKIDFKNIDFLNEINIEKVCATIEKEKPQLVVIDSIQTVYSSELPSERGSINQIKVCTSKLVETAKENNIPIIIIGHITKDGSLAGPKSLEHLVDTVIYLENNTNQNYSILRTSKNRFGSINEVGILEMTNSGFKEVVNPSLFFLKNSNHYIPGSAISCIIEGTRPFLLEAQALVSKTAFGYPQRRTSGYDLNRLQILITILTKRAGINLINQDVHLNIVGGLKARETALDLAVCAAIISSFKNKAIKNDTVIIGEVGLGGEIRMISRLDQRLREIKKLGYTNVITAKTNLKISGLNLIQIDQLYKLVEIIYNKK